MLIHQPGPGQDPRYARKRHYILLADGGVGGGIFKGKCITLQTGQFHFTPHSPSFATLPSICLCGVFMHMDSSTAAPPGTAMFVPPPKKQKKQPAQEDNGRYKNGEERKLRPPSEAPRRQSTGSRTPVLSHDRCLSTGSVEHERHTGVLIRRANGGVGGVAGTDV